MKTITPKQRIENVMRCLNRALDAQPYLGRAYTIRSCKAQLAEMWVLYRRGELQPVTNELPF